MVVEISKEDRCVSDLPCFLHRLTLQHSDVEMQYDRLLPEARLTDFLKFHRNTSDEGECQEYVSFSLCDALLSLLIICP